MSKAPSINVIQLSMRQPQVEIEEQPAASLRASFSAEHPNTLVLVNTLALEMATDIRERDARLSYLICAIRDQLTPEEGREPVDPMALALVEILDDCFSSCGQQNRLIECLKVIGESTHA